MVIVGTRLDGQTEEKVTITQVVGAGTVYLTATFPALKTIDAVLQIHSTSATSPAVHAFGPESVSVSGNVVGFSLYEVAAGTTLVVDVVAVGF